jgi:hypothetical protein
MNVQFHLATDRVIEVTLEPDAYADLVARLKREGWVEGTNVQGWTVLVNPAQCGQIERAAQ